MADYGASDTSTTTLGANQFPISEAWVPNAALTPVEGVAQNTDAGGKKSTAVRMGMLDGDQATLGAKADAVATTDTGTFSLMALFKRLLQGITTLISQTANPMTSATATRTNVTAAVVDTSLLASNTSRKGALFYNDSTAILYLAYGAGAASTTSYSVQVPAQGFFELPLAPIYTGAIRGIWSAANGAVRISELS